jgi:hypothetical protein
MLYRLIEHTVRIKDEKPLEHYQLADLSYNGQTLKSTKKPTKKRWISGNLRGLSLIDYKVNALRPEISKTIR